MKKNLLRITGALALLLTALLASQCCCHTASPKLVELINVIPDLVLDIRYATADNFTHQVVYPSARCFLIQDAACALRDVQDDLKSQGYRLKIFDGYRPLAVQWIFWNILPDPNYVADPNIGSKHNRGYAADVSLVTLDGSEVTMPTEFDDFTERAGSEYTGDLPADAIAHRAILRDTMERHGFTHFPTEWWHYDYQGWEDAPNLDIAFDDIPLIENPCEETR